MVIRETQGLDFLLVSFIGSLVRPSLCMATAGHNQIPKTLMIHQVLSQSLAKQWQFINSEGNFKIVLSQVVTRAEVRHTWWWSLSFYPTSLGQWAPLRWQDPLTRTSRQGTWGHSSGKSVREVVSTSYSGGSRIFNRGIPVCTVSMY